MRINLFSRALKKRYPFPVRKIPLDAGFTCPNRDGTKGRGGCTYCENRSFSPNVGGTFKPIERQIEDGIRFYRQRFGVEKFIAYYQAYSNTYAPLDELESKYAVALRYPEVVGISIGTRPDCLSPAALRLVESMAKDRDVWLEIGLESSHDRTLEKLNRQHSYAEFEDAVGRAAGRGFEIVTHLIYGLPGESYEEMMVTTDRVARLPIDSVKIHHLYIAPNTALEAAWERGEVPILELHEWVSLCASMLERIPERVTIQRIVGELKGPYVRAPLWGKTKSEILQAVEKELTRRGTFQGSRVAIEVPSPIATSAPLR